MRNNLSLFQKGVFNFPFTYFYENCHSKREKNTVASKFCKYEDIELVLTDLSWTMQISSSTII